MYSSLTCAIHHSQVLTTVGSKSQQRLSNSRVATSCTLKEIVFCARAVELCAKMGQSSHLFKRHGGSYENKNKSSFIIIVALCNSSIAIFIHSHTYMYCAILNSIPSPANPSCLQATAASLSSQSSPHTGVHVEPRQYSTSPFEIEDPLNK